MPSILFVCTGNTCRSPMAAGVAVSQLSEGSGIEVRSAGLLDAGVAATPETVKVMAKRGLDLRNHRSQRLDQALSIPPDLVVGMAREHVRALVDLAPELLTRAFTLKELVGRAERAGGRLPEETLHTYIRRLAAGRSLSSLAGVGKDYDVEDPIGKGRKAYERCADEVEYLVGRLVELLWPPSQTVSASEPGHPGPLDGSR